jgi:uncharacterized membrane protein
MAEAGPTTRLEAFSDGVFAIALTLLIIDVRLPASAQIGSRGDLWRAIGNVAPTVFAFLLSFLVIFITWVNHHGILKLIDKSSPPFVYGNGLLLLGVVFIPFPTSLLGNFLLTDFAAPAVVLYNGVLAGVAMGWVATTSAALKDHLAKGEHAVATIHSAQRSGALACAFYVLLAILAFWFPLTAAVVTTGSWLFWLVFSVRLKTNS